MLLECLKEEGSVKYRLAQQRTTWFFISMILALFAIAIFALVFSNLGELGGKGSAGVEDNACRFSNQMASFFKNIGAGYLGLSDTVRFCKVDNVHIKARDWSKCYPEYFGDPEKCATQQLADLIYRCWYRAGEGKLIPGSFTCFTASIDMGVALDPAEEWWMIEKNLTEAERAAIEEVKKDENIAPGEDLTEEELENLTDILGIDYENIDLKDSFDEDSFIHTVKNMKFSGTNKEYCDVIGNAAEGCGTSNDFSFGANLKIGHGSVLFISYCDPLFSTSTQCSFRHSKGVLVTEEGGEIAERESYEFKTE